jgi:hypothetical protein
MGGACRTHGENSTRTYSLKSMKLKEGDHLLVRLEGNIKLVPVETGYECAD